MLINIITTWGIYYNVMIIFYYFMSICFIVKVLGWNYWFKNKYSGRNAVISIMLRNPNVVFAPRVSPWSDLGPVVTFGRPWCRLIYTLKLYTWTDINRTTHIQARNKVLKRKEKKSCTIDGRTNTGGVSGGRGPLGAELMARSGPAASTLKPPLLARPMAVLRPCTTTTSSGLLTTAELHCALHRPRHGSRAPGGHKCPEMTFNLCMAANKNTTQ